VLLSFLPPEHMQGFSTPLSFAERFEWGSSSKECLLLRGNFRSLELFSSGQQRLRDIRGGVSVPRIVFFGPAAPSRYSRWGFGPSNCFLRASNAFEIFETGVLVPRIVFFGPAAPSRYSRRGFGPSNCLFGSAMPTSYSRPGFGPLNCLFGSAMPASYSRPGFGPSNCLFWLSNAFKVFELELRTFESSLSSQQRRYTVRV
jgi:hypothetical protein